MLAIAILATLFVVFDLVQRHQKYREIAGYCESMQRQCRAIAEGDPYVIEQMSWSQSTDREWNARYAEYFARMQRRFEHAASKPWVNVYYDPPPR